jgi:Ras homolog gene family, member A
VKTEFNGSLSTGANTKSGQHATPYYVSVPSDLNTSGISGFIDKSQDSPKNGIEEESKDEVPTFGEGQKADVKMKIVIVGDRSVGKTCFILSYGSKKFPEMQPPTVLEAYKGHPEYNGTRVKLEIYDTAGHEDFQRVRPISYNNADAILVCFSLVDRDSLLNACTKWYQEVRTLGPKCPVILVGTKMDLRERLLESHEFKEQQKAIKYEHARMRAKDYNFTGYVECSAANLQNLNKVMYVAIDSVLRFRNEDGSFTTTRDSQRDFVSLQNSRNNYVQRKRRFKCSVL